jgi:hypothetical protein
MNHTRKALALARLLKRFARTAPRTPENAETVVAALHTVMAVMAETPEQQAAAAAPHER